MLTASELRPGLALRIDGVLHKVIDATYHGGQGKMGGVAHVKLRNLATGTIREWRFRSDQVIEEVTPERLNLQFLYSDGTGFHFMDTDTYEQFELQSDFVGDAAKWLKENDVATVLIAGGDMMGVEPPMFVELEIVETDPGFKGDTVQGGTKPATLETGAVVAVPLFLNTGDRIKVDTREGGRYVTRA